jgi:hypothetical protein
MCIANDNFLAKQGVSPRTSQTHDVCVCPAILCWWLLLQGDEPAPEDEEEYEADEAEDSDSDEGESDGDEVRWLGHCWECG